MALITQAIYSGYTIPTGTNTSLNPTVITLASNIGDALAFDFLLTSGSVSPGPNAAIQFYFAYSLTGSYSGTAIPTTLGFSRNSALIRMPTPINTTVDVTPQLVSPVMGNYLYAWLDTQTFLSTATISVTAVGITF